MRKSKQKEQVYKSMKEFEKRFFPISFKKRLVRSMDLETLAANLSIESLKDVGRQLMK